MTEQIIQPRTRIAVPQDVIGSACTAGNPLGVGAPPPRRPAHLKADALTVQQRRITRRLLHGDGAKQIACALRLSPRTVYWHQENLYARTGSHSLGEFLAWAYRHRDCCGYAVLFETRPA